LTTIACGEKAKLVMTTLVAVTGAGKEGDGIAMGMVIDGEAPTGPGADACVAVGPPHAARVRAEAAESAASAAR